MYYGYQSNTPLIANGKNEGCFDTLSYLLKCAENYFYKYQLDPQATNSVQPLNSNDKYVVIKKKLRHYSDREKIYLDMLYWSAFLNMHKFVIDLIKVGISPFVDFPIDNEEENALVSAIRGGAYEVVKAIIELEYKFDDGTVFDARTQRNFP